MSPISLSREIPLGEYLLLRISQANPKLRSVFGIPGDFNLPLLEYFYTDSVQRQKDIQFVGICNELNAAYAADGYAKGIHGLSVCITTLGVGELSAINGIAGSFAEHAPVLHIVGCTSTAQRRQAANSTFNTRKNIHHLLPPRDPWDSPDHDVYKKMASHVSVALETLDLDAEANVEKIDKVMRTILQENRPGYLYVPVDVSDTMVSADNLRKPFDVSELRDTSLLKDTAEEILEVLYASKSPAVVGDTLMDRFRVNDEFVQFSEKLPSSFVKLFSTNSGRILDETKPNFVGVYGGKQSSNDAIKNSLELESDSVFVFGFFDHEFNNGFHSYDFSHNKNIIEVHPDYVRVNDKYTRVKDRYTGKRAFSMRDLMEEMNRTFDASKFVHNGPSVNNITYKYEPPAYGDLDDVEESVVTENKLVDFFNKYLREDDIVMVEVCSFLFAVAELRFPKNVAMYSQSFYSSIGNALPCTVGLARAERDLGSKRRIILIEGDGSAQMTIQELSSFMRYECQPPQIFLLNNEGYTIERAIKGPTRDYNDIQENWKWKELLKVFGDPECKKHEALDIATMSDLEKLHTRESSGKIEMLEVHLAKLDFPMKVRRLMGNFSGKA